MDPHWRRTRLALLKQVLVPMIVVAGAAAYGLPRYGSSLGVVGEPPIWPFNAAVGVGLLAALATYLASRGLIGRTAHAGNRGGATTGPWLPVATYAALGCALLLGYGVLNV